MKKTALRILIVLTLACFLTHCGGKPTTEKPTEQQIKAFQSVKSVRVKVEQTYSGNVKAKLPFNEVAASALQAAGLKMSGGDATLSIEAKGAVENQKSVLHGTMTFKLPGAPKYVRAFEAVSSKPHLTKYYARVGITYYDTDVIYQAKSFTDVLFRTLLDAYGPEAVANAMKDKSKEVKRSAARVLGESKDVAAIQALILTFVDQDAELKSIAVEALAKIGQPAAAYLAPLLNNKDMVVRRHAMTAMAMIADPNSVGPWIDALRDEDPKVQQTAILTLVKAGPIAVDPLLASLNDKDKYFRKSVIVTLGEMKEPKAIPELTKALSDKEPLIQKAAVDALAKIGAPAVGALTALLKDGNAVVRIGACSALGAVKDPQVVDPLVSMLKDKDRLVRVAAILALTEVGDKKAIGPLTEAGKQKNLQITKEVEKAVEAINKGKP